MMATPTNWVTVTDWQTATPLPQALDGVAQTWPEPELTVTLILAVPCPEVIVQPDGTVQL